MKHFYSLITLAAATLTASAATPTVINNHQLKAITAVPQQSAKELKPATSRLQLNHDAKAAEKTVRYSDSTIYTEGEEGEATKEAWTSLGTGKITAAFFEMFGITPSKFDVEIEETPIEGGRKFRCLPFSMEGNAFYEFGLTETDEENYMVFYAMDNGKSYFEDFTAYGIVPISQYVAESDWEDGDVYATFDGDKWTVPAGGVLAQCSAFGYNSWYFGNNSDPLTISLPGSKDYSATITTFICADDFTGPLQEGACQAFIFGATADAAYVKCGYLPGHWDFNMDMVEFANIYGEKLDHEGTQWIFPIAKGENEPGIYTAFVASYDDEDQCQDIVSSYFFILDNDEENWEKAGTAIWNESLYSGSYNNWEPQQLTMDYEENKNMPGYIRLVNPYAEATTGDGESIHTPCDDHNHYIYIDDTIPDQVKIEPSVTGSAYSGRGAVMTLSYEFENYYGYSPEEIKEEKLYGTLSDDNKIVIPKEDVVFGEKAYQNGSFLRTNSPMEIALTPTIVLNEKAVDIEVGSTINLVATTDQNNQTEEVPTWTSADESVAIVDAEGNVTGVSPGTTTITATYGGRSASCEVTVTGKTDMINEITTAGVIEAYDLQGRRVISPSKGLYIVRQGSKVVKTVVK